MKLLLVCMEYDYGDPSRGRSYEYYNFYQSLKDLGHEVSLFDYMAELKRLGKTEMNQQLLALVQSTQPDLAMFSLYTDQLDPAVVSQLRQHTRTLCFFHDDTWRVEFSQFWARHFDFFTTPDVYGERKYAAMGLPNAIHCPWLFSAWPEFSLFDGAVLSFETGFIKPNPQIYQYAVDAHALDPAATLYIDDLPQNIATGRHFGFQCFQYDLNDHPAFEHWLSGKLMNTSV